MSSCRRRPATRGPEVQGPVLTVEEAVGLLEHRRSVQRRRGATALRRRADPTTAPALEAALRREVLDPRTWETQYQLLMALGVSAGAGVLPWLRELALVPRETTMTTVAVSDALVRIGDRHGQGEDQLLWCLRQDSSSAEGSLSEGAQRAVAMVPVDLSQVGIRAALRHGTRSLEQPPSTVLAGTYWVAVAAVDWLDRESTATARYLEACLASGHKALVEAVRASSEGRRFTGTSCDHYRGRSCSWRAVSEERSAGIGATPCSRAPPMMMECEWTATARPAATAGTCIQWPRSGSTPAWTASSKRTIRKATASAS